MSESVTLRPHLLGTLNDLVDSAAIGILGKCSIVCELVATFVDYQEEGASLFLDAFLTDNLDLLTALIPNSARLHIGTVVCDEAGVMSAVKKTAPLVRGCWKMYLCAVDGKLEFGLFRDSGHPLNIPIDLTLQSGVGDAKFIRVSRLAQDAVRVSAHNGMQTVVHFTNAKDSIADVESPLRAMCEIICSKLDEKAAQSCRTYLNSLLSKALRESHGSLIAVIAGDKVPKFLDDCTRLTPAIDLSAMIESVRKDSNILPELHAIEAIVCGTFCCDGIVVLNTSAKVMAYNAFVKLEASNVVGGARKRAYKALCTKVGNGLKAAYFQSQDGASDLRRETL